MNCLNRILFAMSLNFPRPNVRLTGLNYRRAKIVDMISATDCRGVKRAEMCPRQTRSTVAGETSLTQTYDSSLGAQLNGEGYGPKPSMDNASQSSEYNYFS